jgi:hypothetical protein
LINSREPENLSSAKKVREKSAGQRILSWLEMFVWEKLMDQKSRLRANLVLVSHIFFFFCRCASRLRKNQLDPLAITRLIRYVPHEKLAYLITGGPE